MSVWLHHFVQRTHSTASSLCLNSSEPFLLFLLWLLLLLLLPQLILANFHSSQMHPSREFMTTYLYILLLLFILAVCCCCLRHCSSHSNVLISLFQVGLSVPCHIKLLVTSAAWLLFTTSFFDFLESVAFILTAATNTYNYSGAGRCVESPLGSLVVCCYCIKAICPFCALPSHHGFVVCHCLCHGLIYAAVFVVVFVGALFALLFNICCLTFNCATA